VALVYGLDFICALLTPIPGVSASLLRRTYRKKYRRRRCMTSRTCGCKGYR